MLWISLALAVAAALIAATLARRLRRGRAVQEGLAQAADLAEARAERAELRREAALSVLTSVAVRLDRAGRITEVNPRGQERFPFLRPGMGVLEAFSEHRLAGRVARALERLEPERFEVRLFVDGRRTHRASIWPYRTAAGPEALLLLTDVSEAVAYQELRSQFVANVSHELRTPLTGLRGLLEALDDPVMRPAQRSDFVARCISETQRLEALVADILFLSELEATEGLPTVDRCDLREALEEAAADVAEVAASQAVTVEVHAPDPVPCPLSLRMAVTVARNLLENAAKYAGHGATARATVAVEDGRAVLRVVDDGAGIPERHLAHVFERFYRADPSRSKRLGGTGLGLSIVKHIAERFGGSAEATSREGFGTTVTVALPLPDGGDRLGGGD